MRMFSRNFSYNQNVRGSQQGYQAPEQRYNNLPLVPAPGLAMEYFPTPYVGGSFSYNRAIAGSKDAAGSVYKTTAYDWSLGVKGRFDVIGAADRAVARIRGQGFQHPELRLGHEPHPGGAGLVPQPASAPAYDSRCPAARPSRPGARTFTRWAQGTSSTRPNISTATPSRASCSRP